MSHPCGTVGVYDGVHKPIRYFNTLGKSDAAVDDVKYDVLGPCPALATGVADSLDERKSRTVETHFGQDEPHLRFFGMEPSEVQFTQLSNHDRRDFTSNVA